MPAKRKSSAATATAPQPGEHDNTAAVTAFLGPLKHPLKPLVETIRATILESAAGITEGIKWNTASFDFSSFAWPAPKPNGRMLRPVRNTRPLRPDRGVCDPAFDSTPYCC